ncbi:hypothetical protein Tco_1374277, partial [Tanacetum coccineum]
MGRVPKTGPSIGRVPKEGPSIGREYLFDTYFPSTDKDTTDKDNTYEDNIEVSYSPESEGKYVLVRKRDSQKVFFKILIPATGCVLGLVNAKTWDEIVKKVGIWKTGNCADKGKRKTK